MRYVFALFCLLSLSACQAPAMTSLPAARFASQAALPPDMVNPKPNPGNPSTPKPCNSSPHIPHNPLGVQAFLPPDAIGPKPNPCPCRPVGSQAFLPPDAIGPKPPHC